MVSGGGSACRRLLPREGKARDKRVCGLLLVWKMAPLALAASRLLRLSRAARAARPLPGAGPDWGGQGVMVAAVPPDAGCRVPRQHRPILPLLGPTPGALVGAGELCHPRTGRLVPVRVCRCMSWSGDSCMPHGAHPCRWTCSPQQPAPVPSSSSSSPPSASGIWAPLPLFDGLVASLHRGRLGNLRAAWSWLLP